jgi:hypothetical protein
MGCAPGSRVQPLRSQTRSPRRSTRRRTIATKPNAASTMVGADAPLPDALCNFITGAIVPALVERFLRQHAAEADSQGPRDTAVAESAARS